MTFSLYFTTTNKDLLGSAKQALNSESQKHPSAGAHSCGESYTRDFIPIKPELLDKFRLAGKVRTTLKRSVAVEGRELDMREGEIHVFIPASGMPFD
jgi:hypothetical protein